MSKPTQTERLARIETKVDIMSDDIKILKKAIPTAMKEMERFLGDVVGRYAQSGWVDKLDRKINELEFWRERVDHNDDLDCRLDKISKKIYGYGLIMGVIAPILYFILNNYISKLF